MSAARIAQLPEAQKAAMRKAQRLEWLWIAALASIVALMYFVMGDSQAMQTAWIEDVLSFVPPVAFLAASWIERLPPSAKFPIGYVRITSIAYLVSAVALAGVGLFLVYEAASALLTAEHPTIGSVEVFGQVIWLGWLMLGALAYSVVLPVIFGRLKMRPAQDLHDKVLWADALMNKADWLTGLAAAAGVIGIGFGLWWADAAAALVIAGDVLHDGYRHTTAAVRDLMDEVPRSVDDKEIDPLPARMQAYVAGLPWVRASRARLREEGRFVTGTIYAESAMSQVDPRWIEEAERGLRQLHWRVDRVSIMPLPEIEDAPAPERADQPS